MMLFTVDIELLSSAALHAKIPKPNLWKTTVDFGLTLVQYPVPMYPKGKHSLNAEGLWEAKQYIKKKMQLDVDIEPTFRFTYMKCIEKQKDITLKQLSRIYPISPNFPGPSSITLQVISYNLLIVYCMGVDSGGPAQHVLEVNFFYDNYHSKNYFQGVLS